MRQDKSVSRTPRVPLPQSRQSNLLQAFRWERIDAILWLFIAPGDLIADRLGVTKDENRDLVRMLVNGLFWIAVVVVGLAIWTSTLPIYR